MYWIRCHSLDLKNRIQQEHRLVGFVLPCNDDGLPIQDALLAVFFESMEDSFRNGRLAKYDLWHSRRKSTFRRKNTKMSYLYHVVALTLLYLLVLLALQSVLLFLSYKGKRVDH